ncbi:peptidoglycan D,D-transpeptidase FtsI family protein [Streptosporangium minutum]|uniref:Peptidoglycan glycosyltransferase n=1 Tax=Streptosporangium minutum TaxID=569862 RepID=A0A243RGF4_9ACTN|nr:penicillin-binding protein 2 [Streptosporangium minutum]OUC93812.1 peptidoglycan glycosyltransferase [Streptosporangium minutum]
MVAPRARRINIPLRHVALVCGAMLFALLGKVTYIQALDADRLNADPRNHQTMIARFAGPRGEILLRDGTVIATSRDSGGADYRYRRVYPAGPLYAPVTGHISLYGGAGIEKAEDAVLSGGDPRVKVRSLVYGTESGATLKLTVDGRAQRAAYEALRATGLRGAVVAINPATGAILAMVSLPSYDPNLYTTFDAARLDGVDRRLQADPGRPLLNRAIQQNYPPGSAFKIVTSAAALASGRYSPTTEVGAPEALRLPGTDTYLRNSGGTACGDGNPPLAYAFKTSCNTPFAKIGIDLGQDALREQAEAFGFGADDLTVPMPVARSVYPPEMDRAQTAMSALGQFDDRATPLMIAMISAAVANDGVLMRPYLVEEVRLADGTVIDETEPSRYRQTLDEHEANRLTAMMVTVTRPGGTGTAAAIPGVDVAAKTGTAENAASGQDHAIFTSFAPAADPRVAVGVLVEHGGFGGRVAAPIAKAVMQAVLGDRS